LDGSGNKSPTKLRSQSLKYEILALYGREIVDEV